MNRANTVKATGLSLFSLMALAAPATPDGPGETPTALRPEERISFSAFAAPSREYRPKTWFHWIAGHVATNGLAADLKAIADAGIGGVQMFHGQLSKQPWASDPENKVRCLSPEWKDLLRFAADEAHRLGLTFEMQNCPGWSMSGGPWIRPEEAMRRLVCASAPVVRPTRGKPFRHAFPKPKNPDWKDWKILAFPKPRDYGKSWPVLAEKAEFPEGPRRDRLALDLDAPQTIRAIELSSVRRMNPDHCYAPDVKLTLAAEGRAVGTWDVPRCGWQDGARLTLAVPETTARRFELTVDHRWPCTIDSVRLLGEAKAHNYEGMSGSVLRSILRDAAPPTDSASFADPDRTIDLTQHFDSKTGVLDWPQPALDGEVVLMRVGHENAGLRNDTAPPEAQGWECDKLSPHGIEANFNGYVGALTAAGGPLDGRLDGVLLDSWECRTQNWTPGLDRTFEKTYGYSPVPFMPALLGGTVVGDRETTERFYRDWRKLVGDLIAENYYGRLADIAHARGLKFSCETAAGDVYPGDILSYWKKADTCMCEFWEPKGPAGKESPEFKPVKPCVSAAHLYGRRRVGAEAFTNFPITWRESPRLFKDILDFYFAWGVTHPVFHTYTHNPNPDYLPPGSSFGTFIGSPFLRLQTWWPYMRDFTDYIARCSYLLEAGRPVKDVLLYLGDEADHKPLEEFQYAPAGHQYDYCNADVLVNRLTPKDGRWTTPEGLSYGILYLHDSYRLTVETMQAILKGVAAGARIAGRRPRGLATLSGGAAAEKRFEELLAELPALPTLPEALAQAKIEPDVVSVPDDPAMKPLLWNHRTDGVHDWYFATADGTNAWSGSVAFRTKGEPEIWNPTTARREPMRRPFALAPSESVFVVFGAGAAPEPPARAVGRVLAPTGWTVAFDETYGLPHPANGPIAALKPWHELTNDWESKAYSGTCVYRTAFEMPEPVPASVRLDLGDVNECAEVRVNGRRAARLWSKPYSCEVAPFLRPGTNELEIAVTSLWYNRLLLDGRQKPEKRRTFTHHPPKWRKEGVPYEPNGLLGPVTISY